MSALGKSLLEREPKTVRINLPKKRNCFPPHGRGGGHTSLMAVLGFVHHCVCAGRLLKPM